MTGAHLARLVRVTLEEASLPRYNTLLTAGDLSSGVECGQQGGCMVWLQ